MNLETKPLKAALERLCLVVPKKGTLPVLENLRWRVVKGHLELTATDLDNSLYISMPSAAPVIPNSVDVLVPAKELYQAVKTESAPNMEIRIHDGKLEVRANNASAESTRYSTDVVKLEMRDSVFRIVGTDGHRLSVVEGAAKTRTNSAAFSTLLLRSTASILSKLQASGESAWVQFSTCGSEQEFNLFVLPDGSGLIARRSQGQFPNYENVIPKAPLEAKVVFRRDELLDGLTKLSATARRAQNSAVQFELSKSPPGIRAEADGTANRVALEHARVSGKARDIGFNHQYLTQYVKSLETDTVSMTLFPRAISDVALFDSFRYRHLLMPLRD